MKNENRSLEATGSEISEIKGLIDLIGSGNFLENVLRLCHQMSAHLENRFSRQATSLKKCYKNPKKEVYRFMYRQSFRSAAPRKKYSENSTHKMQNQTFNGYCAGDIKGV